MAPSRLDPFLGGGPPRGHPEYMPPEIRDPREADGMVIEASAHAVEAVMRALDEDCGCGKKKRKLA